MTDVANMKTMKIRFTLPLEIQLIDLKNRLAKEMTEKEIASSNCLNSIARVSLEADAWANRKITGTISEISIRGRVRVAALRQRVARHMRMQNG